MFTVKTKLKQPSITSKPLTVAVTGASGFVGSHLVPVLTRYNRCKVVMLLRSGSFQNNAFGSNVEIRLVDYQNLESLKAALVDCDVVVHLIAKTHDLRSSVEQLEKEYFTVNVELTRCLLEACQQVSIKRFIYLSSTKVNGDFTKSRPFSIQDEPKPNGPYGQSKQKAESLIRRFCIKQDMEFVIVRTPLIYGPSVKGNFRRLLSLAYLPLPAPLASLQNLRDMVYVGNLCDFLLFCICNQVCANQAYLFKDGSTISTAELLKELKRLMGKRFKSVRLPLWCLRLLFRLMGKLQDFERLSEPLLLEQDCLRQVSWRPPISMRQGLAQTVQWYLTTQRSAYKKQYEKVRGE